jgi:hypothetical protein
MNKPQEDLLRRGSPAASGRSQPSALSAPAQVHAACYPTTNILIKGNTKKYVVKFYNQNSDIQQVSYFMWLFDNRLSRYIEWITGKEK